MSLNISSDSSSSFIWDDYLIKVNGRCAKAKCFKQSLDPPVNNFEINTILEAEDQRSSALDTQNHLDYSADSIKPRNSNFYPEATENSTRRSSLNALACGSFRRFRAATFSLARVIETKGPRIRVRLIGTDDRNDYWFLVDSDQIRPYPSGNPLQPPFGFMHNHLVWNRTLKKATEAAKFADPNWFITPPAGPDDNYFQVNDKLEAVDRRNTQLICPATIGAINGCHVLISFDGWSGAFDYWTRFDSRELFPVGWCKVANYPLQSPGPNAIRSPNSHSTPSIPPLSTPRIVNNKEQLTVKKVFPRKISSNRINKRSFSSSKRIKSRAFEKSTLLKQLDSSTPYEPNHSSSVRECFSSPMEWINHPKSNSFPSKNTPACELNLHCSDSSISSISSPPVIHPIRDESSNNMSSLSDQPPKIDAMVSQPQYTRHRQTSSSSDCVVRLQVKSSIQTSECLKPELKSWQVVTEPRVKVKKSKTNKHHKHQDMMNGLKQKIKLVNSVHNQNNGVDKISPSSMKTEVDALSTENHNDQQLGCYNKLNSVSINKTSNINNNNINNNTTTNTTNDNAEQIKPTYYEQSTLVPYCNGHKGKRTSHPYLFEDTEDLSIETNDDPSNIAAWINNSNNNNNNSGNNNNSNSNKTGTNIIKSALDSVLANPQSGIDYLDNQSLSTTHLPSSTVSPSSLDLGSCPLSNPSQWTIDEVYQYITTRDSSLVEAAEKFKHHEIDGQALLLLCMESLRNYMKIKLGPALKIDHLIGRLKRGLL